MCSSGTEPSSGHVATAAAAASVLFFFLPSAETLGTSRESGEGARAKTVMFLMEHYAEEHGGRLPKCWADIEAVAQRDHLRDEFLPYLYGELGEYLRSRYRFLPEPLEVTEKFGSFSLIVIRTTPLISELDSGPERWAICYLVDNQPCYFQRRAIPEDRYRSIANLPPVGEVPDLGYNCRKQLQSFRIVVVAYAIVALGSLLCIAAGVVNRLSEKAK